MGNVNHSKSKRVLFTNLALLVISVMVMLMLVELGLMLLGIPKKIASGWKGQGKWDKNQLGFRGQPIEYTDNDFVILLLGDSQVEADALSQNAMPETRLQYYLNETVKNGRQYKVFSVGTSGYGQDQQLIMLKAYFKRYRADMVLLWFTHGNDIWNNIFPTHWPKNGHPKPTFHMENGKLTGPNIDFGNSVFGNSFRTAELLNRALIRFNLKDRPEHISDDAWEKYLPTAYLPQQDFDGPICLDWQKKWDEGAIFNENFSNEKSHLTFALTPRSKRMNYGIQLTTALLTEIHSEVVNHNAIFGIFYKEIIKSDTTCNQEEVVHQLNGNYFKTSKTQFKKNITDIMGNLNCFPIPVNIIPWKVSETDAHLNNKANDAVMHDLSRLIQPLLVTEKSNK